MFRAQSLVSKLAGTVTRRISANATRQIPTASILSNRLNFQYQQNRFITDGTKATIEDAIKKSDITVFMKGTPDQPQCGFSRAVIQILQIHGVTDLLGVNCLADENLRQGIKEYTDWPTIPQVYIKGEFVGGCDVMIQMHQSGELHEMLIKNKLIEPDTEDASPKEPESK
ncbi:monothiol glutaredoxin grx5 [Mycoemilia scoparia]|uniref:Monothiol glutaredoxin-5, mitochondrial n=1 Tax=Mycoemilia scoparia TaxID=417184 RepID=A0A9W7ZTD6_9FUNG|nr:monothiol glutaredoxin grx5 [Mycoemilia scoparia]